MPERKLSKAELRKMFAADPVVGPKIDRKSLEAFLKDLKLVKGHVAHMEYEKIQHLLDKSDFLKFLNILNISEEKFKACESKFCYFGSGERYCSPGSGYCDSSWCHAV